MLEKSPARRRAEDNDIVFGSACETLEPTPEGRTILEVPVAGLK